MNIVFRSALKDCELALKLNPNYVKVLKRAANCCYNLNQFNKCIEFCDRILELEKDNKTLAALKKECVKNAKLKARNERKQELETKNKEKEENALLNTIRQRGYHIEGNWKHWRQYSVTCIIYSLIRIWFGKYMIYMWI